MYTAKQTDMNKQSMRRSWSVSIGWEEAGLYSGWYGKLAGIMVLPWIRFINKGGMLVGVKAFYEKRRCMMVDRQVVAVEVLECSDERVSGEEMRSSDYKLTNGVFFVDRMRLETRGQNLAPTV
eukprot:scaffold18714_cov54-Cyclotella_meneghiniana.AAC.1